MSGKPQTTNITPKFIAVDHSYGPDYMAHCQTTIGKDGTIKVERILHTIPRPAHDR